MIRQKMSELNNKQMLLFVFLLLTRQKNVYQYVAKNKIWDFSEEIEGIFEKIFVCIVKESEINIEIIDKVDMYNPENVGWEDKEEDIMGFMITFMENLRAFINQLMERNDIDLYFSQCNYDYLEAFLYEYYEWTGDNTQLLLENVLIKEEVEREIRDIDFLSEGKEIEYSIIKKKDEMLINREYLEAYC